MANIMLIAKGRLRPLGLSLLEDAPASLQKPFLINQMPKNIPPEVQKQLDALSPTEKKVLAGAL